MSQEQHDTVCFVDPIVAIFVSLSCPLLSASDAVDCGFHPRNHQHTLARASDTRSQLHHHTLPTLSGGNNNNNNNKDPRTHHRCPSPPALPTRGGGGSGSWATKHILRLMPTMTQSSAVADTSSTDIFKGAAFFKTSRCHYVEGDNSYDQSYAHLQRKLRNDNCVTANDTCSSVLLLLSLLMLPHM